MWFNKTSLPSFSWTINSHELFEEIRYVNTHIHWQQEVECSHTHTHTDVVYLHKYKNAFKWNMKRKMRTWAFLSIYLSIYLSVDLCLSLSVCLSVCHMWVRQSEWDRQDCLPVSQCCGLNAACLISRGSVRKSGQTVCVCGWSLH